MPPFEINTVPFANLDFGLDFPEKENYRVIYRVMDKYRVIILIQGENTG